MIRKGTGIHILVHNHSKSAMLFIRKLKTDAKEMYNIKCIMYNAKNIQINTVVNILLIIAS